MPINPQTWLQQLRDLLCQLYQQWGGNCQDLGPTPPDWITTVENEYGAAGPPPPSTKSTTLQILSNLESLINETGNSLSPEDNVRLLNLIANVRQSLNRDG